MPDALSVLHVLNERSARFAMHPADEVSQTDSVKYISFRLGSDEYYGIPYHCAEEVMRNTQISPLPSVPPFIRGIINRRGRLLAILDLKHFFPVDHRDYEEGSSIIIVSDKKTTVGILADSVEGSDAYSPGELEMALPSEAVSRLDYISGLHKGTTAILDIEKILKDPGIQTVSLKQQ